MIFYLSSPAGDNPRKSEANLENDTERKTRKQRNCTERYREDSEDSKEFSIARC